MSANETVREVCAEMCGMGNYQSFSGDHARELANRVEAAYEREMASKDAKIKRMHDCCDALEDEFDAKDAEIAHLKSALLDAIARTCNRDHGECARCVREGVFNCPARRWKAAMDGEAKEAK